MKAIWKGSLTFGLVTIDVGLFTAVQEHAIGFTLLHEKCKKPIRYKRWCEHCNQEIPWENIVKGLKVSKDNYIILDKQTLQKFKPEKSNSIIVNYFVDTHKIPLIYLNNHYYLAPLNANDHAFGLLAQTLFNVKKSAIGSFVFKEKDHVCALTSYGSVMVLSTLHYSYEIRPIIKMKAVTPTAKEFSLAENLIAALSENDFDISTYKDTFLQKLAANIKKYKKLKILPPEPKERKRKQEEPSSLLASLEASIKKASPKKRRS